MNEAVSQVPWLAVLAASIAHFALGGLWYMVLFSEPYARSLGIAGRPPQKPSPMLVIGPFLCSVLTISTTALLLRALRLSGYGDAFLLGLVVGVGYLAPMTVTIAINPLFPRPLQYALVNAPMFVLGSLLSCAILVAMS